MPPSEWLIQRFEPSAPEPEPSGALSEPSLPRPRSLGARSEPSAPGLEPFPHPPNEAPSGAQA